MDVLDAPAHQALHLGVNKISAGTGNSVLILATVTQASGNSTTAHWFGYDSSAPPDRSRLTSLEVRSGATLVKFDDSMLAPLAEPHWITLQERSDCLYLQVNGLDAANSYIAIFTITKGRISERLIASGEFRHEVWERTIYHNDFDEYPDRYKNM